MPYKSPLDRLAARQRYKKTAKGKAAKKRYRQSSNPNHGRNMRPFIGVDGEGGGTDELGRQHYRLLRAGDEILFDANRPLSSSDCLAFLAGLDPRGLYVSYFFDYDTTQILRDVPGAKLASLFARRSLSHRIENKQSDTILWSEFQIGYFPRKHLKVRRVDKENRPVSQWVTIHDVGSFFQMSFVQALTQWEVLTNEQRAEIAADKARRDDFDMMGEREIAYNKLECEALALLMEKFRDVCVECGYVPKQWEGPGWLASAMMNAHNVTRRKDLTNIPMPLWPFANAAYYGGRFEIFKIGEVENVTEYDICSAYPAAYLHLPCLEHGSWEWSERPAELPSDGLYIADIRYSHREDAPILCHLPCRTKSGSLVWQREGRGKYWSGEIRAAIGAGTIVREIFGIWAYKKKCECQPFGEWVQAVYQKRLEIGKSYRGYPIKLALNSIYGKCCQSIGRPPYANPIWGGLITSYTRTRLIAGYTGVDPSRVVMLATDGLYMTGPPLTHLPIGLQLGDWERSEPDRIFVIKPGMYAWANGKKVKTRGVPKREFGAAFENMRQIFLDWQARYALMQTGASQDIGDWPTYPMPQTLFIGTRLALHRHKPELAGKWIKRTLMQSFDPTVKRRPAEAIDLHITTTAHLGSPSSVSIEYNKVIGGVISDEHREVMKGVLSIEPFEAQVEAEDFALLISGLDDVALFDDDDEEFGLEDIG